MRVGKYSAWSMLVSVFPTGAQRLKRGTWEKLVNRTEQLEVFPTLGGTLRISQEKQEADVEALVSSYIYTH